MRILRIAGAQLASLDAFEVDFEAEPLRSAGVFAITGPTGAGKSTILDAMCVALFGETPRIYGKGGSEIVDGIGADGQPRFVRTSNVGNLLRRGAAKGFAELDFVGIDRHRYRARWEIHRARGKAHGALQQPTVSLHELGVDGSLGRGLGGTPSETRTMIVERVGLDAEQFRRAVLLPQGDFAAFLRAAPSERAELLEQMTGTEIYMEISRQAYLEGQAWDRDADRIRRKIEGLELAADEVRAAWVQELDEIHREVREADAAWETLTAAQRWHETAQALDRERAEAEGAAAGAAAAWQAAEPMRRQAEEVEAAQAWRASWEGALRARADARRAAQAAEAAAAAAAQAQAQRSAAEATAAAASAVWREREAAWEATEPLVAQARSADEALARAGAQRSEAEAAVRVRADEVTQADKALADLERRIAASARQQQQALQWLQAHPAAAWAVGVGAPLRAVLEDIAGVAIAWPQQDVARARAVEVVAAAARAQADAALAISEAKALRERHQQRAEAARAARDAIDAAAIGRAQRAGREALAALAESLDIAHMRTRAAASLGQEQATAAAAAAASEQARQTAAAGQAALREREAARGEAEAAWRRWQAALDLTDRRAQLEANEPCPLCGATEHPYAAHAPPPALLAEQRRRVDALSHEIKQIASQSAAAAALADAEEQRRVEAVARGAAAERDLADAARRWAAGHATLAAVCAADGDAGVPAVATPALADDDAAAVLAGRQRAWHQALTELERQVEAWRLAGQQAQAAEAEVDTCRGAEDAATQRLAAANQSSAAAAQALAVAEAAERERHARVQAADAKLAPLWQFQPTWQAAWRQDPAATLAAWDGAVQAARARQGEAEAGAQGCQELAPLRAVADERVAKARDAAAAAQTACALAAAAAQQAQAVRAALLGGRPVDAFVATHRRDRAEAQRAHELAMETADRARSEADAAAARGQERLAAAATAAQARDEADAALSSALSSIDIDEATLEARLALDERWRRERRDRIVSLRAAVERADGACRSARQRHAEHHTGAAPEQGAAEVAAAVAALAARRDRALQRSGQLQQQLAEADRRSQQAGDLQVALRQLRESAASWWELREVLGSADGSKLRKYAQGLTLDVLVAHANHHLGELSRRYRLARAPHADLELQVIDGDQADEIRALTTLSGGETFLVSLALALALASISSRATAIESLFIDEGFGTLDPATLEVAMNALRNLAAVDGARASSRKVGVISHVPHLADGLDAQIRVEPRGGGLSQLRVVRGWSSGAGE